MATTNAELIWLRQLSKDFDIKSVDSMLLFCDNDVAIQIATNPSFHERTKHIEVDCYFVREKVDDKTIRVLPIRSAFQLADIFTKPLPYSKLEPFMEHEDHKEYLLLLFGSVVLGEYSGEIDPLSITEVKASRIERITSSSVVPALVFLKSKTNFTWSPKIDNSVLSILTFRAAIERLTSIRSSGRFLQQKVARKAKPPLLRFSILSPSVSSERDSNLYYVYVCDCDCDCDYKHETQIKGEEGKDRLRVETRRADGGCKPERNHTGKREIRFGYRERILLKEHPHFLPEGLESKHFDVLMMNIRRWIQESEKIGRCDLGKQEIDKSSTDRFEEGKLEVKERASFRPVVDNVISFTDVAVTLGMRMMGEHHFDMIMLV
ncbi:hypothetical protein LXL04_010331 [Taraxacum kok-saghyz]